MDWSKGRHFSYVVRGIGSLNMAASSCHTVSCLLIILAVVAVINGEKTTSKANQAAEKTTSKTVAVDEKPSVQEHTRILKSHHHIEDILKLNKPVTTQDKTQEVLQKLLKIYHEDVKPLEEAYRFSDLNRDAISDGEIFAKPMVLFLGPWSVGKSTMINYLLGVEDTHQRLHTGAEPTTSDFTVLVEGSQYRTIKGMELVTDTARHFSPLQKFGLGFTERLQGRELPSQLLRKVILVDTPGIIENKKQQQRGYPFNEVCQWFIDRADLIFLVFDPTKLDVGSELSHLFFQLKGHDAKLRLILNKADTVSSQELMRVYGALFWSLAPLVNVVEPPRVYVGSFWVKEYRQDTMEKLFYDEEVALLDDLNQVIQNQLENKVSYIRRHAFYVRLHALIVDSYIHVFNQKKYILFGDNDRLLNDILDKPHSFHVLKRILSHKDISRHDLPRPEDYKAFFSINPLELFQPVRNYCNWFSQCAMERLETAISKQLPQLLSTLKTETASCSKSVCKKPQ